VDAEPGLGPSLTTVADPAQALLNAAVAVFFRGSYRAVLATVIAAGATLQEAEDAVSDAMAAVLNAWGRIESPLAYARRAALRSFIKARTRGRAREQVGLEGVDDNGSVDPNLTVWEDGRYVTQLLESLRWLNGRRWPWPLTSSPPARSRSCSGPLTRPCGSDYMSPASGSRR
jgi:DNA-directed RNA polymerase specialized sigma24 family protein